MTNGAPIWSPVNYFVNVRMVVRLRIYDYMASGFLFYCLRTEKGKYINFGKDVLKCQGRNVTDSKRRAENDPIARIVNAGILTAGYGSAEISAGGAVWIPAFSRSLRR